MIKVYLAKKISRRVVEGHPWIFSNEVDRVEGEVKGGETVTVFTHDNKFIGSGYINPRSQIMVRLLTRNRNEVIDEEFFYKRILQSWEYRKKLGIPKTAALFLAKPIHYLN
jgi:23S rRNA (cytosine1962-C5)-methyltransferase